MSDGTASLPSAKPRKGDKPMVATKTINLALQGGGAHGAFAWGVLDRLLDDDRIAFEGISATSAGAMNAAVMAYGLAVGMLVYGVLKQVMGIRMTPDEERIGSDLTIHKISATPEEDMRSGRA